MSEPDAVPLPRDGEVFFDVRGDARTMRLSWYGDSSVAVFSIWQGNRCTGTFRLPFADLARMVQTLQSGPPVPASQRFAGRATGYQAPAYSEPAYSEPGYSEPGYGSSYSPATGILAGDRDYEPAPGPDDRSPYGAGSALDPVYGAHAAGQRYVPSQDFATSHDLGAIQDYATSQDPGAGQADRADRHHDAGQPYDAGRPHDAGQPYDLGQYGADGQYGGAEQYGVSEQYGAGEQYGVSEQYGAAGQYGAVAQYSAAGQYSASQPYGAGQQYGASEQYGSSQQYGGSQPYSAPEQYSQPLASPSQPGPSQPGPSQPAAAAYGGLSDYDPPNYSDPARYVSADRSALSGHQSAGAHRRTSFADDDPGLFGRDHSGPVLSGEPEAESVPDTAMLSFPSVPARNGPASYR
jgi:hypothetical protein